MNPAASASDSRPHVVIVGAGFGGLWAARSLAKKPVRVTVIDRNNFHSFFPLLYQVAAAELEPEAIVYPVRGILRRFRNVDFRLGEVRSIEFGSRRVETVEGSIPYDYLVLAVGSTTHYFGVEGAEEHGYSLRTLEEGVSLRNRILRCFERAVYEQDRDLRRELLTFTIVGGGATGVEFAGALAELVFRPLRRDLPEIDFREARILLLEAAPALLQAFPERLRRYAQERLVRMGVEVRTGTQVTRVSPRSVTLADGDEAPTRTVVWTAGVEGDPVARAWGLAAGRGGRIALLPTLQSREHDNLYVVGDLAECGGEEPPAPMVAPAAIQQGSLAARNILRQIAGEPLQNFRYRDQGMMATIGRNAGVVHLYGRWSITGFAAWLLWLFVHLAALIGFRNRLVVLMNWAWDYLFFERVARLIIETPRRPPEG